MINLITSFYLSKNKFKTNIKTNIKYWRIFTLPLHDMMSGRQQELDRALRRNIKSNYIKSIHLFVDDKESLEYLNNNFDTDKLTIISVGKQPMYSDLFKYSNNLKNKICMVSNNDIWLKSIKNLNFIKKDLNNKTIYCLTRHEHDLSCRLIKVYNASHDAFIFRSPINNNLFKKIKHYQNVWGSENVVIYELRKLKYRILNPCMDIIIVHEHASNLREAGRKHILPAQQSLGGCLPKRLPNN